ncbi:MAG TPA: hypothetical protein VGJ60_03445 [Chloroflexota bacterium]
MFWAPERTVDPATSSSAAHLVRPLFDRLDPQLGFAKRLYLGDGGADYQPATKQQLREILAAERTPAILFSASHGLGYRQPDPRQVAQQGALVTQEYVWRSPIGADQWFGAADVGRDWQLRGLMHYAFACFGAGTPQYDDYDFSGAPAAIAAHPFVAALPRQLLRQGALAFIGHVELAWGYSFMPDGATQPGGLTATDAFQRALRRLMTGEHVGHVLRDQHDRGVHLSSSLLDTIARSRQTQQVDEAEVAQLWTERNDARAYIVLGDPAARLRVDSLALDTSLPRPHHVHVAATSTITEQSSAAHQVFVPPPPTTGSAQIDNELLEAWKEHVKLGFQHSDVMFRRVSAIRLNLR